MPSDAMPHTAQLNRMASCSTFSGIQEVDIAVDLRSGARGQILILQIRDAGALSMVSVAGRS